MQKNLYIPIQMIMIFLLILFGILFFLPDKTETKKFLMPMSVEGQLDLTDIEFCSDFTGFLNGDWEFYWNELLEPDDFLLESFEGELISVPGPWNHQPEGAQEYPALGYGTYRLRMRIKDPTLIYALHVREIYTSFHIWINGQELASGGKPGRNKEETIPQYNSNLFPFTTDSYEVDILIQVSNFHFKDGGLRDKISFGSLKAMHKQKVLSLMRDFFLFGALIIMGIYHLGLFQQRKEDISTLLFGLYCLIISTRILVTNDMMINWIIPDLPWNIQIKIIVLGYYVGFPLFFTFIKTLFPEEVNSNVVKMVNWSGLIFSVPVLLLPPILFTKTEVFYQIIILTASLYAVICVTRAVIRKRNEAFWIFSGILILFITVINDIFHALYISNTHQSLVPFGLFVFVFSQSFVLSVRFSRAFTIANTDELTQISNRHHFLIEAERFFQKSDRHQNPLGLLFLDIDFFKKVNDTYGHDGGDHVLKIFAELVGSQLNPSDLFGRLGGEEFAVLIPGTPTQCIALGEKIRATIEGSPIIHNKDEIRITVSIGVATTKDNEAISLKKLSKSADLALYEAKKSGRNRVVLG
ncbi:MAG: diguanylate cyclase [Spirochaetales bacterium]|nr:diguanylate cyclase [Spirochaetales bacterium]